MKTTLFIFLVLVMSSCNKEDITPIEEPKSFDEQFLDLVNGLRTNGYTFEKTIYPPVAPLHLNDLVKQSAQIHCDYMNVNGICHSWADHTSAANRLQMVNFRATFVSQQVSKTMLTTAKDIFELWIKQQCVCDMLMDKRPDCFGIAENNTYFCLVLATEYKIK